MEENVVQVTYMTVEEMEDDDNTNDDDTDDDTDDDGGPFESGTGFDTDDANRTDLPFAAGAAGSFSPRGGGAGSL